MTTRQQRTIGLTALLLLALGFLAALVASNTLLRGMRIDLTENKLYTISAGTRRVLQGIDEPINLYYFFSDRDTADIPFLRTYATRVREMLEEFATQSDGKLILQVIDPLPFSEDEDRATQFGLQPVNLGALGESIFFGLAGTNSVGGEQTIGFFQPDKEAFLEYDLARLVYSLANPDKPVVGLLSGVSMTAGFDPQLQRVTEPWVITTQAQQLFDIRNLTPDQTVIDPEIDILWIVHPQNLSPSLVYAIDQFVLRGGRALIFVDPFAEIDMANADPTGMAMGSASNLAQLFDAWGIEFSADDVVADNRLALSVGGGFGARPMRHIGLLGLNADSIDAEDVVTSGLTSINVGATVQRSNSCPCSSPAPKRLLCQQASFSSSPTRSRSSTALLQPVKPMCSPREWMDHSARRSRTDHRKRSERMPLQAQRRRRNSCPRTRRTSSSSATSTCSATDSGYRHSVSSASRS
jgi:ABC-type uncharacterized transport system involved in gliding motility auxiliary subunit